MKTLLKNIHLLTMDEQLTEIKNAYLFFSGEAILGMGESTDLVETEFPADQIIDGKQGLLIPGLINTHTHAGMIPFRSLGDDVPDRLRRFLFPLERYMTKELVRASSDYAIAEMLLSGTTTFCDMYYFEEEVAQACQSMGVRALVGETIIDMPTCDSAVPSGGYEYGEAFIKKWQHHPLITPIIAPHAPNTNRPDILEKIVALSKAYEVPITMHVAEMTYEMEAFQKQYQQTPIAYLAELGYFERECIMAHCILATEDDLDRIAQTNQRVRVAHCIGANTKSAKGVAPVKQMIEKNIVVGLGTDGPSSGNTLDLFTQMRLFASFHKTYENDRALFPAKEIVRMATFGGAQTLGLADKVGSIEVGKQADLTLVETESVNMFPIFNPYSALVYSANAKNVSAVWVKGELLVKEKQLVRNDLATLREQLYQTMGTFAQKAKER